MLTPLGNEALVVLAIKQGMLELYFPEEILAEYRTVLARPKFGFAREEFAALVDVVQSQGALLNPPAATGRSPDSGDDKFIACALESQADFLVTGNKRDFPESQIRPTKVVTAAELLDRITLEV